MSRPTCKACGNEVATENHLTDAGMCGMGCDIAFEAGLAEGRRLAMAEVVKHARERASGHESRRQEDLGHGVWTAEHFASRTEAETIAAWAEARGKGAE